MHCLLACLIGLWFSFIGIGFMKKKIIMFLSINFTTWLDLRKKGLVNWFDLRIRWLAIWLDLTWEKITYMYGLIWFEKRWLTPWLDKKWLVYNTGAYPQNYNFYCKKGHPCLLKQIIYFFAVKTASSLVQTPTFILQKEMMQLLQFVKKRKVSSGAARHCSVFFKFQWHNWDIKMMR